MIAHTRLHTAKARLETALNRSELDGLSAVERAETLSLLLIELQRRIGLDLMSSLDPESERHFKLLAERQADSDEIAAFFSVRIPEYRDRVESVVENFCEECRESLDCLTESPL